MKFYQGQKIESIRHQDGGIVEANEFIQITVSMQNGPFGEIAWARIEDKERMIMLTNLSLVLCVTLPKRTDIDDILKTKG